MLFFQQKKSLRCFLSLALDLCCPFSRWGSLACRLLSLFLCLSQALHSKFVDMTTQIQKQFPLSVFVLIDSLVVSALQDAGGYAIFLQKTSSCVWVATPLVELFTLVCLWCWRTVGRAGGRALKGTWLPKFLGWVDDQIFYHNDPLRAFRPPESSASNHSWNYFESKYVTLLDYRYTVIYSFVLLLIQILIAQ